MTSPLAPRWWAIPRGWSARPARTTSSTRAEAGPLPPARTPAISLPAESRSSSPVQQPFDDHHVTPVAVELGMLPVRSHLAEAVAGAEGQRSPVLREDPRDQLPEAGLRASGQEVPHQGVP